MKPKVSPYRRSTALATIQGGSLAFLLLQSVAFSGNTWTGGGSSTNWSDNNNWGGGAPGYGTLTFTTGGTQGTTSNNNSITAMNMLLWTGSASWTLNGTSTLSLYDFGGTQAKIENQSTGLVTINAPITFAATTGAAYGEINAVNGDITFGTGTLTVNGSGVNGIKLFGNGRTTTFNNTVSASGKWFGLTATNTTMAVGGTFTSGDIYVMNGGTLKVNSGGSITSSAIRLGGDFGNTGNQNQTLGGTLQFTSLTGGQTFSSVINTVTGNTSNALLIDSLNTSGTNTLSAASFLDSDLKTQVASGGTLSFTGGSIDVKIRKLTVGGAGTTIINEALTSSFGAGGLLVKEGAGTLILQGTSNTYTGTNNATLNASGTAINAGTLGIYGDGSLGLAPAGAYNNIQFTGSATLQDTANNISLNATRNISIASGATASFDSNGNTFTVNGVINGTGGSVAKIGSGTLVLTNTNSYNGTTTISAGKLTVASTGTINNTSGVSIAGGEFNYNSATALSQGVSFSGTGGKLSGGGTITPAVTITSGNTLAPGNSIGTLSFGSGLTLAGTYSVELGTPNASPASGLSDRSVVTGALSIGGNLTLVDNAGANGQGSAAAGAYRIATYTTTRSGTFASITNPLSATLHEKVIYGPASGGGSVDLNLYRLAAANTITTPVALGNARVGGTLSQGISVQNTASGDGFSEGLNASGGSLTGNATTSGSITNLSAGSSSTAVAVGLDTTSAGAKTGTVQINLASNGSSTSGYGNTSLSSQTVTVNGAVFNAAQANTITTPVNLGKVRVGGSFGTSALTISNTSPSGAYTEGLNAASGAITGAATASGSVSNLAGASSSTSISVGLGGNANTGTSGVKSGNVTIDLASSGTNSGLADLGLASQTVGVSGTVYDYAITAFSQTGGAGSLTGGGNSYTLDFGTGLALNTLYTATIQLANTYFSGFQDDLGGTYGSIASSEFTSGVEGTTITSLVAGSSNSFTISFYTGSTGTFSDTLTFGGLSQQSGLSDANLGNFNIALSGVAVPEPRAALLGGLGLLALLRRRRP